jgi:outer membrane protein assembly factor BamB
MKQVLLGVDARTAFLPALAGSGRLPALPICRMIMRLFLVVVLAGTARAVDTYDLWQFTAPTSKGSAVFSIMTKGAVVTHATMTIPDDPDRLIQYWAFGQVPAHFQLNQPGAAVTGVVANASGLTGTMSLWAADAYMGNLTQNLSITLAVSADAGHRLSGTVSFASTAPSFINGQTLTLTGRLTSQADNLAGNSLPPGADWASWNGPNGDFTAPATLAQAMVDTPDQARLRWISEDFISHGSAGGRFKFGPNGGCASPIVYGGRIYLYHYVASGSIRFDGRADNNRDPSPDPWGLVEADDVIVCIDAATGRRIWRKVYERASVTAPCHKGELQGMSMAAADGRVFAVGSTGTVYCHDAVTGALLWSRKSPIDGAALEAAKATCMDETYPYGPEGRDGGRSLQVAGGNLILPPVGSTNTGTLVGLDAATGTLRWRRENLASTNATPLVWRASGMGDRLITTMATTSTSMLTCVDAATGRTDWTLPAGIMNAGPTMHGDLLFANLARGDTVSAATLTCLRLGLAGPTELWRQSEGIGGVFNQSPGSQALLAGGDLFFRTHPYYNAALAAGTYPQSGPMRIDPATGVPRWSSRFINGSNEGISVGCDQFVLMFKEYQHGGVAPMMLVPGENRIRGYWHPRTFFEFTAYQTPWSLPVIDGRVFVRGGHNLYCYDFRKPSATGQPPSIAPIADQVLAEDGTLRLTVTIADAETPVSGLQVSAVIGNPRLASVDGSPLGSRLVTLTSEKDESGSAPVTVYVTDEDGNTASRTFQLTVTPGNDDATLAGHIYRTITAGSSVTCNLINEDPEGAPATFTVAAPVNGVLSGSGAARTYTPNAGFTGVDTFTYTATASGVTSGAATIRIQVLAARDTVAPTVITPPAISLPAGTRSSALAFTVGDDNTPVASLEIEAYSSDELLLPRSGMVLTGSAALRSLTLLASPGMSGPATVTLHVMDAAGNTARSSFLVTITGPGNTPPTSSAIPDQYALLGTTFVVPFTVGDAETSLASLLVAKVGGGNITIGGSGAARTATVALTNTTAAVLTSGIKVTDGQGLSTTTNYRIILSAPGATAPTITAISAKTVQAGTTSPPIGFEIGDAETLATGLRVAFTSSNTTVLPLSAISLGGAGLNRYLILSPPAGASGSSTVTVTVTDGGSPALSTSGSFTVTVPAGIANQSPVITAPAQPGVGTLVVP